MAFVYNSAFYWSPDVPACRHFRRVIEGRIINFQRVVFLLPSLPLFFLLHPRSFGAKPESRSQGTGQSPARPIDTGERGDCRRAPHLAGHRGNPPPSERETEKQGKNSSLHKRQSIGSDDAALVQAQELSSRFTRRRTEAELRAQCPVNLRSFSLLRLVLHL